MGRKKNILKKILFASSDANIRFVDLCNLLQAMGFEVRIRGSHHLFSKRNIVEKINLQKDGAKAKPYQVKQVRSIILKYKLGIKEDE